ncbi:MAG: TerB family tellurite resistance protein [Chloroflexota bacterium]|nr:TerB family tellurite resistance protein [Chloroflexota bacterium]
MLFRRFLQPQPPADGPTEAQASDAPAGAPDAAETATVRRIVARLDALPPAEARHLAAFAYVMSRAANADLEISDAETAAMERYVVELGGLDEAQAVVVVQMAKLQARLHGATEDFLVTREFARIATEEQKLALLRCCFAVGAADDSISADEASVANEIARELDLSREQLNAVRAEFVERLSAIQALRRLNQAD